MIRLKVTALALAAVLIATGCQVRTQEFNQRVMQDLPQEVQQVQSALDRYMEQTPVLPIKSAQGHLYEKYVLDLNQLDPYLGSRPSNSYEKGGHFVFVVADPGTGEDHQVRAMDLRVTEKMRDLKRRVDRHQQSTGKWPRGHREGEGVYQLDFEKLGIDPVTIPSPYSAQWSLPVLIDGDGVLFLDYRAEVVRVMEEQKDKLSDRQDLRELLWKDSLFVPAYSPPMEIRGDDPVLLSE
ncbi:hypothetical protein [Desmospora profundinema]|uniref:Uncharacterized protein n=1 Tax=Desmospora profundinema TaxID=1571184 RepID=A0ABU1IIY4_9BACL|nr:hypothetical protein [Desmospora profundinema]MDR6224512.1 hypothetical protein [Desmospora profundinema]